MKEGYPRYSIHLRACGEQLWQICHKIPVADSSRACGEQKQTAFELCGRWQGGRAYPLGLRKVGMYFKILKDSLEGLGRVKRIKETP